MDSDNGLLPSSAWQTAMQAGLKCDRVYEKRMLFPVVPAHMHLLTTFRNRAGPLNSELTNGRSR